MGVAQWFSVFICVSGLLGTYLFVFPRGYPPHNSRVLVAKDGFVIEGEVSSWQREEKAFFVHAPKAWRESSIQLHCRCDDRGKTWAYDRGKEARVFRTVVVLTDAEERT